MNATITVVKVTGHAKWAEKCVMNKTPNEARYRTHFYKSDAIHNAKEWEVYDDMDRNYWHNFNSLEDLGIAEKTL
jgi:hypothetical protein